MRLPCLQFLLVDCSRTSAEDWFYKVGCLVSLLTMANSLTALVSFCVDFYGRSPIYHSLPQFWHFLLYAMCLLLAVLVGAPQLMLSLIPTFGISCTERSCLARLARMAGIENFYHRGSFSRYLFLATLTTACVILLNTISVLALYHGVGSLFDMHATDNHFRVHSEPSIDAVQQHYKCCGREGFTDWLKMNGRVPGSCASASTTVNSAVANELKPRNRSTSASATAIGGAMRNGSIGKPAPGHRNQSATLWLHGQGCLSPLTSEQAILCGIGNMLAFAGVLLLVAVWTRVERLTEVTVAQLKSTTFNHPRHFNDASAFLEQRQMQQASRFSVHSSADRAAGGQRRSDTSSETPGHARRVYGDQRVSPSEGFLHLHDAREAQERHRKESSDGSLGDLAHGGAGRHNSIIDEGSNSNNSALEFHGAGWRNARVVNSVDRRETLRRAWELQGCCRGAEEGDTVQLVNEQPLDARRLFDGVSVSPRRRRLTPRRRVTVGCVTQSGPTLLEDLLSSWDRESGVPEPPFCTWTSGRNFWLFEG